MKKIATVSSSHTSRLLITHLTKKKKKKKIEKKKEREKKDRTMIHSDNRCTHRDTYAHTAVGGCCFGFGDCRTR